jgi:hypothetical protein
MSTYSGSLPPLSTLPEELSEDDLHDVLVSDTFWQTPRDTFFTKDESRRMWAIIQLWQDRTIGSVEALQMLDGDGFADPDALMLGFAAVQRAKVG